jgi:hypothetical protein
MRVTSLTMMDKSQTTDAKSSSNEAKIFQFNHFLREDHGCNKLLDESGNEHMMHLCHYDHAAHSSGIPG